MKLSRMGKPPYLKPHHVVQDDVLEILAEPYVQSEEESKFGRARGYIQCRLLRTGESFTWGLNTTTWDRLIAQLGEDSQLWIGKKVKVKIENQLVRGESKQVMFGVAYQEPQKSLV